MKSLNKLSKRFILFSLCVCSWFFGQLVLASELDNSILNSLKQDNLEEFQTLVQQNTVLTSGINEEPLIHLAVLNKAKKITRWLTKQSIDINQIDNKLHTALTHSLVINDLRTAKYLVKQGAQVNLAIEGHQLNQMGIDRQPLAALIFDKAPIKSIDWLIKRGATLSKESNNQNLYPLAISASHRALVDRFLDLDSPPFEQPYVGGNFDGLPLVILACFQTKQDIVIRALSQGLNPELTFNNLSLLNLCIVKDNLDVVKKLVESGAHLSTADVSKAAKADYKIYQFLSTWIEQRKALTVSALKALLEKNPTDLNAAIAAGFDVNTDFANSTYDCATCLNMYNLTEKYPQLNRDDTTPLMIATSSGDLSWVNHVIAAGATVSYQNKNQRNALSAALTLDTMDIANRLISLGSELTKYQVAALLVEKHYQLVSSYLEEHPEWLDHWINNHGYQIDKVIESLINSQQLVTLKQLIAIGFKFDQTSDYFYPINLAIHTGNLQVVSLIVENTENEKRYQYHNPLELSLALKKKSITKTLVQYGFEVPDYPSDAANAELLRLFTQTDSKLAELLCTRSGFNPYKLPEDQITYPILSRAISVCPNDFAQDSNSYHWLKRLLLKKDFKLAGKLTKLNVDVNTKPASYDPSLLSLIIKTGSIEALKFLVENGVSLIPTEQYQAYPVVTAINSNQPKMALYLAKQFKKMQGKKAIPTNLISEIISLQKSNVLKQLIGSRTKDTPVLKEACEKETSSLVFCRDNNLLSDVDQELEIRLTRAVKYQNMDTVTSLLSAGVSPNLVNIGVLDENQSLLMLAASSDSLSLVNLLLEKGANPNRLIGRNSALDSATWSDNSEIFKRLYQVSGKLLKDNRYSDRIVDSLAYRNNEPLIGWLMANNYPLSNHLLAGSAQWISPALFSQMIAYDNGNLWKQSNQYNALLNLTSSYSEFTVDGEQDDAILRKLNALVDAGASLTKPKESEYSSNDQNLLSESISQGSAPIVNWLLDKGLTLPDNFRDYGDTLLTLAKHSDTTLLARLFKAGLSPDKENTASIPLLAYAIDTNNQSLTRLLLQSRSDPNQYFQNFDNQTPLLLAISKQHTSLATLLIEHGANVNQRDGGSLGISPLMLAIEQSNVSLVDALLANGAAVDATDNEGKSVNQRLTIGSAIEKKISGALNSKSRAVQVNLNITNGRSSQTALDVSDNKELALRPLDSDTYGIDAIELWDETNQRALRMLDKASNSISAVIIAKFLNDREAVLSVNENSPLKIVDLNSGAVKKRITFDLQPKTKTRIQVAALSNNKQYLAMASDNAVNLVDLTKQKIVKHWPSLNAKELQFSPSNQVLYAVGSDSNLVSLGITDNKRADFDHFYDHRIKEPEFIIGLGNEKFLLAEGDSSLSSSSRSKVWLFDAASRKILKVFDLGFSTIETIATNRNHSYLAVATHKYFKVFDLKQGNLIWQSPINDISSNYSINDVTFISENRVILSNQISNKIDMVDIPSRSRLTTHTVESVNGIKHSLSDNENGLILSGGNQLIRFKVDATNGTPQINKITQRSMETDIIALLKHQQDIIAIESNNQISLNTAQELTQQWRKDLYTDSDLRESCLDNRTIVSAVTLSKRSLVIQCYSFTTFDGKSGLYKWDVDTSKLTKINSEWSTESINSFHIDQVTKKLYTVGPGISSNTYMKEITLSESKTENGEPGNKYRTQHLIKNQSNLTQPINALAANENVLLSGSRDKRQLHLWDDNFQSLKLQNENIEQYVSGIALSNNNHLSVNWQTNWLEIWDIKQSKFHSLIRTEGSITTAVFSKNGKHLLVATEDGKVHNYSVDSSELNYSTTPAQSRVRAIALSPNGKQFVTASRSIQRRNTKTGELINEIHLASGLAESIQFDMTGNIRAGIVRRLDENGARLSRIEIINPESGQVIRSRNKLELLTQSTDGEHYVTYSNLNGIQVWQNIDDKLVRQIAFENFNRWDNGVAINKNYLYVSGVEFLQKFSLKESVDKDAKSEFLVGSGRPFKPTMSYSNDRNWALNMVSADYSEWFDVSNNKRLGCTQGNLLEYQSINIDPTNSQLILNKGEQQFQLMPDSKDCQKPVAMPANDSSQKIHQQLWRHQIKFRGYRAGIANLSVMAPSHSHFAMVKDNYLHVASLQTGSLIGPLKAESQMVGLRFSLSGRKLVSLHYDGSFSIWDSETGVNLFNATTEYFNHETIEFDTNEQYLSIDSSYQTVIEEKCTPICNKVTKQVQRAKQRWSLNERKLISIKRSSGKPVDLQQEISRLDQRGNSLALKTDSIYQKIGWGQGAAILSDDQQMTAAFDKGKLLFWKDNDKTTRPEIIYEKASYQPPSLLAFIKDNQFLLVVEKNGDIAFYDTNIVKRVARMKVAEDSTWVALDEQGRYDSNSPGDLPFASWVSDDSPLEALPIEVFMNDFFKPRLIPRLLSGEQFSPVKSIASINRVRPKVSIEQVEFESNTNRLVTVTVKVSEQSGATRDNSTSSKQRSGFQGLRLFRDNKQVAYSPVSSASETNSVNGLKQSTIVFNGIQLPASDSSNDLIFSSYAFNRDNIKSATTSYTLTVKPQEAREKPKAYVIAIGVNEYNNPAWDLTYAVPDANAIHQQVVDGLQSTGKYSDVISINLSTGDDVLKPSKETIRQVLAKLSGKGVSTANTELTTKLKALKRVKPEDTVLISYSGHGYASADGDFHLFPWDIAEGNERTITPELLQSTITSEDLNEMLRDIDSDNFLMVIDACNSSASVEGKNFKPGPMGSSGLGQLAYNKQMMILTASQAEEFALESDQLNHGLLTYSLVEEGLRAQSADRLPKDNSISAREWLSYAINRVPELYQSLVESPDTLTNSRGIKVVAVAKDNEQIDEKVLHETVEKTNDAQRPGLFDFSKNKQIIISNHQ